MILICKSRHRELLTETNHAGIFKVLAINLPSLIGRALRQVHLGPRAMHIVQHYGSATLSEFCTTKGVDSVTVSKLSTDDRCVAKVPIIVTNRTPLVVVLHFYSALIGVWAIR